MRYLFAAIILLFLPSCVSTTQGPTVAENGWDRYLLLSLVCHGDSCVDVASGNMGGPYYSADECKRAGDFTLERALVVAKEYKKPPDTLQIVCVPVVGNGKEASL